MKLCTTALLAAASLLTTTQCAPNPNPGPALAARQSYEIYGLWAYEGDYYLNNLYDWLFKLVKRDESENAGPSAIEKSKHKRDDEDLDLARLLTARQTYEYAITVDSYEAIYEFQLWLEDFLYLVQQYGTPIKVTDPKLPQPKPL
ncbi:hypothetical protein G647_08744 [Cladophialophora carrionii CBS 160.54]|uniref:Uncharacterized protein n=1 Tax=Cladophialophora carrionii CBS 160.54 TaxID=1279043 RepID=V9CZA1_9EURO|nr:uncharacterized protein G647_08744 [Cladophialophora carrionii CBS 160.54]ETI19731.1 hypothetical protein G647_08744 [Cladophialophora carrionii CBS 160.54]